MSQDEVLVGSEVEYKVGRGYARARVVEVRRSPAREETRVFVLLTNQGKRLTRTADCLRKPR